MDSITLVEIRVISDVTALDIYIESLSGLPFKLFFIGLLEFSFVTRLSDCGAVSWAVIGKRRPTVRRNHSDHFSTTPYRTCSVIDTFSITYSRATLC